MSTFVPKGNQTPKPTSPMPSAPKPEQKPTESFDDGGGTGQQRGW